MKCALCGAAAQVVSRFKKWATFTHCGVTVLGPRPAPAGSATEWRKANPEKALAYNRKYREVNREHYRELARAWKARNPEKVRTANLKYKEKVRDRQRQVSA